MFIKHQGSVNKLQSSSALQQLDIFSINYNIRNADYHLIKFARPTLNYVHDNYKKNTLFTFKSWK